MKWIIAITVGLFAVFTTSFLIFESAGYLDESVIVGWFAATIAEYGSWLAAVALVGALVGDLFLPVPASITMTLAGYVFGLAGGLLSFVGAMGSALLGFWLCRRFGRAFMRRHLVSEDISALERFFAGYGTFAILLSRAVPMVTEVISCLAGLSAMSARRFAALSALGVLPLCMLYAWAGAAARDASGAAAGSMAGDLASGWGFWLAIVIPALAFASWSLVMRTVAVRAPGHAPDRAPEHAPNA